MHIDDVHFLLLYTESLKNNCILSEDYVFYCSVDIPTARSLQTGTRHRRFHIYITFITDVSPILSQGPGWLNELGSWITYQLIQAYHQYCVGSHPAL